MDDWDFSHLGFFFKKEDAVKFAETSADDHVQQNNEGNIHPEDREQVLLEEGDETTWVYVGNSVEIQDINRPEGRMTYVYFTATARVLEVN